MLLSSLVLRCYVVPSAPVAMSAVGIRDPRGFKVTWQELPCKDVNAAEITSYIIRYRRSGSGQYFLRVAPSSSTTFTFFNTSLESLVGYELQVAAVNGLATGEYSAPVEARILQG